MRTRQEGAESLPGKTCVIVKIATTGCDRAEDELLELTLLDARTRLDTPVMPPPLYFGRFRPRKHRDWPEAGAATASRRLMCRTRRSRRIPGNAGASSACWTAPAFWPGSIFPSRWLFWPVPSVFPRLSDVSISWKTGRATPRERGRTAVPCGSAWEISSAPCG